MNPQPYPVLLLAIGLVAGLASGVFGIGGGVLIVPALVYLAGFSQHAATGTSLAILLPPVGLAAVLAYYRFGHVELRSALFVAVGLLVGAGIGALFANTIKGQSLRLLFGFFVIGLGVYQVFNALKRMQ